MRRVGFDLNMCSLVISITAFKRRLSVREFNPCSTPEEILFKSFILSGFSYSRLKRSSRK